MVAKAIGMAGQSPVYFHRCSSLRLARQSGPELAKRILRLAGSKIVPVASPCAGARAVISWGSHRLFHMKKGRSGWRAPSLLSDKSAAKKKADISP